MQMLLDLLTSILDLLPNSKLVCFLAVRQQQYNIYQKEKEKKTQTENLRVNSVKKLV